MYTVEIRRRGENNWRLVSNHLTTGEAYANEARLRLDWSIPGNRVRVRVVDSMPELARAAARVQP